MFGADYSHGRIAGDAVVKVIERRVWNDIMMSRKLAENGCVLLETVFVALPARLSEDSSDSCTD